MNTAKEKRTVNRPHWKELAEKAQARVKELERENKQLRHNGSTTSDDIARIKSEAFAAGVAAHSAFVVQ